MFAPGITFGEAEGKMHLQQIGDRLRLVSYLGTVSEAVDFLTGHKHCRQRGVAVLGNVQETNRLH